MFQGKTEKNEDQATARILNLVQTGYEQSSNASRDGSGGGRDLLGMASSTTKSRFRATSECRSPDSGDPTAKGALRVGRRLSDDEMIDVPGRRLSVTFTAVPIIGSGKQAF